VITVATNNPAYSSLDGVLLDKPQTSLICYPASRTESYMIPVSVSNIGDTAFMACALTNVVIPGSVTNIGSYAFQISSLESVTLSNGVSNIGVGAFNGCTNLTSVTIPASVSSIGLVAFDDCISLTNVTISEGVSTIQQGAFEACSSLPSITIPDSVTNIGFESFAFCSSLTNVFFMGNAPILDDDSTFQYSTEATAYYLPDTTGWVEFASLAGIPTELWLPRIQSSDDIFGVQTNGFGFNIYWASGQTVVVDACTNLLNSEWQPLQTNTLMSDTVYFSDSQWVNYPVRFYRIRSP